MAARLVGEDEQFYHLHDGKPFRVPKAGLPEALHTKIRGMAGGGKLTGKAVDSTEDEESGGDTDTAPKPVPRIPPPSDAAYQASLDRAAAAKQQQAQRRPASTGYHPRPGAEPKEPELATRRSHARNDDDLGDLAVMRAHGGAIPGYAEGGAAYSGAGGGAPDTGAGGAGGGPGWYGPGSIVPRDMGSEGAEGGASGNERAPLEVAAMRDNAPTAGTPSKLPPGVVPRGQEPVPTPASVPAKTRPAGFGVAVPKPEDRSELDTSEQARVAAETDLAVKQANLEAAAAAEKEKIGERYAIEKKQRTDLANQRTQDAMTRLQAAQDEMNKIDASVDAGRYWASRTTGQKVLGIIGLALGSFGADGVNRSAQLMNQAIDRDLEAQKAEYEARLKKGTQKVAAAQNYYSMAREAGLSELAATDAAKAAALDGIANRLDMQAAGLKAPEAVLKGKGLSNSLRGAAMDKRAAAQEKTFDQHYKQAQLGIENARLDIERSKTGGGLSEGERKAVGDVTAAAKDALGLINSIEGTLARTQSQVPGKTALNQHFGSDAAALDTDAAQLVVKMKDINKLGQLGPADSKLLEEAIGDPKAIFTFEGTKRAKLERIKQIIRDSVTHEREARGLQ